jgi:trans-2,3-dihydro-3-hydroxyanthranilate isomerase
MLRARAFRQHCTLDDSRFSLEPLSPYRAGETFEGIVEDPATGSATAAVAAGMDGDTSSEQRSRLHGASRAGCGQGRPNVLAARGRKRAGALETIKISGRCVEVMEGTFAL